MGMASMNNGHIVAIIVVCTLHAIMPISSQATHAKFYKNLFFSLEVTCNCKMTRVRRWSMSERHALLVCDPNVFGAGSVVPEG